MVSLGLESGAFGAQGTPYVTNHPIDLLVGCVKRTSRRRVVHFMHPTMLSPSQRNPYSHSTINCFTLTIKPEKTHKSLTVPSLIY